MASPDTYQPVLKLIWQFRAYCQGHLQCVHFLPLSNAGLSLLFSKAAFWWSVFAVTLAGSEIPRETGPLGTSVELYLDCINWVG